MKEYVRSQLNYIWNYRLGWDNYSSDKEVLLKSGARFGVVLLLVWALVALSSLTLFKGIVFGQGQQANVIGEISYSGSIVPQDLTAQPDQVREDTAEAARKLADSYYDLVARALKEWNMEGLSNVMTTEVYNALLVKHNAAVAVSERYDEQCVQAIEIPKTFEMNASGDRARLVYECVLKNTYYEAPNEIGYQPIIRDVIHGPAEVSIYVTKQEGGWKISSIEYESIAEHYQE